MGPDDVFAYAKKLRDAGIEEVQLAWRTVPVEFTSPDGFKYTAPVDQEVVAGVRLAAHWSPPVQPEAAPVFDADPVANSIAQKKWEEGKRILAELETEAREDRIRFAHTEGV